MNAPKFRFFAPLISPLLGLLFGAFTPMSAGASTLESMRISLDGQDYLFSLMQIEPGRSEIYGSQILRVACIKGCSPPSFYSENIDEIPLGIFRASDADDLIITTWATGSAYEVKIYRLDSVNITKILDVYSLQIPNIRGSQYTKDLEISTILPYDNQGRGSQARVTTVWKWNGSLFVAAIKR